jgi:hypothetical protein
MKIHVLITPEMLNELGSYEDGIGDFINAHGDFYEVTDYTVEHQIGWITGPLRRHWVWCVDKGLLPNLSMRRIDLSGADLHGACLRGAILSLANLCGANLRHVSLYFGDLRVATRCQPTRRRPVRC